MRTTKRVRVWRAALIVSLSVFLCIAGLAAATTVAHAANVTCAFCQAPISAEALYCPRCGHRVGAHEGVFCWRCGTLLPLDAHFCTKCGTEVCMGRAAAESLRSTGLGPAATGSSLPRAASPGTPSVAAPPDSAGPSARAPKTPSAASSSATPAGGARPDAEGGWKYPPFAAPRGLEPPFRVRPDSLVFPPQLFDSPTGNLLPSLMVHGSGGLSFGFSDDQRKKRWVVSLGLGDVGEATIASSRIFHITAPSTDALVGFRLKVPVSRASRELAERLFVAINFGATDNNDFRARRDFQTSDGVLVSGLGYTYRETTAGLAATLGRGPTRFHGALHWTDLRAKNIYYSTASGSGSSSAQKEVYSNFAAGVDYRANLNTLVLAEIRTSPRISFSGRDSKLRAERLIEYALGVRFFPDPLLGLDTSVSIDDEAVGLADIEIGFGLHFVLTPSKRPGSP